MKTTALGAQTTSYGYAGDGVRMQANAGGQTTRFLWDLNQALPQLALERDGQGTLLRSYLYGHSRLAQTSGAGTFYFHPDSLGSVSALTSQTGAHQTSFAYEPFGSLRSEIRNALAPPASLFRFTGEQLDPTGLYHLRARQYDASSGRFLQQDPASRQVGSPYVSTYVFADCRPTVFVDPTGEFRGEPSSAGEEAAGLAASRLHSFFVTLKRKKGPIALCPYPARMYPYIEPSSGQLVMEGHFPNPASALRRVFGQVNLRATRSNRRETHPFDVLRTRFTLKSGQWTELEAPILRGGIVKEVKIFSVGIEPANPALAIRPDDRETYVSVRATARHIRGGVVRDCVYAGSFGA